MKFFNSLVFCSLCVSLVAGEPYRAATLRNNGIAPNRYSSIINEAGKADVDVLVLPAPASPDLEDNYDEIIKTISKATRQAGLYVVAHLFEKARCQSKIDNIRSNLVFDRDGAIISVYRKPLNNVGNCTATDSDLITFATDFGVNFGLLMEEDLVLRNKEHLKGLKNFVMTGEVAAEIPFLSASQFLPSWLYINNANLISSTGIYSRIISSETATDQMIIADIDTDSGSERSRAPIVNPMKLTDFPAEDMSHYIIRPLDVEASNQGYHQTVCHSSFCCDFYVKTSVTGSKPSDVNYGLAAFDGVRHFSASHNIGTQNCAVFACAGLYKRSCNVGTKNNSTNIIFKKISVSANFTKRQSIQYPILQSTEIQTLDAYKFVSKTERRMNQITTEIQNIQNLLAFGIFGRDFSKDYQTEFVSVRNNTDGLTTEIYDYLYSEEVQEFFDYVWIRLRVLIFVVSIYILEMM